MDESEKDECKIALHLDAGTRQGILKPEKNMHFTQNTQQVVHVLILMTYNTHINAVCKLCYKCPQCERSYSRKDRLGVHMGNIHSDETYQGKYHFECPFSYGLNSSFHTTTNLRQHCEKEHKQSLPQCTYITLKGYPLT